MGKEITTIDRYPGIQPFSRIYKPVFFGRSTDVAELYKFLNVNNLVILYGKSGLGKSSLLNAGLIPYLEERKDYKHIFIRFGSYQPNSAKSLKEIFIKGVKEALPKDQQIFLSELELKKNEQSIWQYVKSLAWANRNADGVLIVLDQFEEIFSYPTTEVKAFGRAIAEVVNDRMPAHFQQALFDKSEQEPSFLENQAEQIEFIEKSLPVKLLMGIRSDRLSLLDRFSPYLPNILRNTDELKPLDIKQARNAIVDPAQKAETDELKFNSPPFTYEEKLIKDILNYLSQHETRPVETFLLQIICQYVEAWVVANFDKEVTGIQVKASDIGKLDTIVQRYYIDVIQGKKQKNKKRTFTEHEQLLARYLIEKNLIDSVHRSRVSLDKSFALAYGFEEEMLEELIDERIIRQEPNTVSGISYELSHDTLIDPVLQAEQHLGKLDEKIEAFYSNLTSPEAQAFIESHFLNAEGQSVRREIHDLPEDGETLEALQESNLLRTFINDESEIEAYELYPMFQAPALKFRAVRKQEEIVENKKKAKKARRVSFGVGALALVALIATIVAVQQVFKVDEQIKVITVQPYLERARNIMSESRAKALQIARYAYDLHQIDSTENFLYKLLGDSLNHFERQSFADHFVVDVAFSPTEDKILICIGGIPEGHIEVFDYKKKKSLNLLSLNDTISSNIDLSIDELPGETDYISDGYAIKLDVINSCAFSPNGQEILVGIEDKKAKLLGLKGNLLQRYENMDSRIAGLQFSKDGNEFLAVDSTSTIRIMNKEGIRVKDIQLDHEITYAEFSPTGDSLLVSNSYDYDSYEYSGKESKAQLIDRNGRLLKEFYEPGLDVSLAHFSPDGKTILTNAKYGGIKLWSLSEGEDIEYLNQKDRYDIVHAAFSSNGQKIVGMRTNKDVIVWELGKGEIFSFSAHREGLLGTLLGEAELQIPETRFSHVSFSKNAEDILTWVRSSSSSVKLWDAELGRSREAIIQNLRHEENFENTIDFVENYWDQNSTASLSITEKETLDIRDAEYYFSLAESLKEDHPTLSLRLLEYGSQHFKEKRFENEVYKILGDTTTHFYAVNLNIKPSFFLNSASFSPKEKYLLIPPSGTDNTVKLLDSNFLFVQDFKHKGNFQVLDLGFFSDGKSIFVFYTDGTLKLWKFNGTMIAALKLPNTRTTNIKFSPKGNYFPYYLSSDTMVIREMESGKEIKIKNIGFLKEFSQDERYFILSPNNIGYAPEEEFLFEINGEELSVFDEYYKTQLRFSPDGRYLIAFLDSSKVGVRDLGYSTEWTFGRKEDGIKNYNISADGKSILSFGGNNEVKRWSLNGELLTTYSGHSDTCYSAQFSQDNKLILTSSRDSTLCVWSLDGNNISTLKSKKQIISGQFSLDSRLILVNEFNLYENIIEDDDSYRIWNFNKNTRLNIILDNGDESASFSPTGKWILREKDDSGIYPSNFDIPSAYIYSSQVSPTRQAIIDAYQNGVPFSSMKSKIEAYLASDKVGSFTPQEKIKYGIKEEKASMWDWLFGK